MTQENKVTIQNPDCLRTPLPWFNSAPTGLNFNHKSSLCRLVLNSYKILTNRNKNHK